MKKLLLAALLLLSSISVNASEIPKGSKVICFSSEYVRTLKSKLEEISNQYTIIDWNISMGLGYGESNHGSHLEREFLLVVFVKEE